MSRCILDIFFSTRGWVVWRRFEVVGEEKKKFNSVRDRSCLISAKISDLT